IPDPPGQGAPWTPPATKLPRSLVDATAVLFEAGIGDPRGCDYREVEVEGIGWEPQGVRKARGFVLPERPGESWRFAVGWDGVVRPAPAIGAKADLEADVRALAVALRKSRESPQFRGYIFVHVVTGAETDHRHPVSPFDDTRLPAPVARRSPLTLAMLLRLGRADLAESLYAAATTWTPETARPDLADERLRVPSLSDRWAETVYSRLLEAHRRGDDAVALDAARRLDRFRKAVEPKAAAPGLPQGARRRLNPGDPVYVRNAEVITEVLADQERRAQEAPRGPVPPRGGDPAARIAALIRDFDQIRVAPQFLFGEAHSNVDTIVTAVAAEGDPAVEPLLSALESDTRLTRCIFHRDDLDFRGLHGFDYANPVAESVYAALRRILQTERFMADGTDYTQMETAEGRKELARAARAWWEKNRAWPLVERWYRTLLDDSAGADRWLEAASGLVKPPGGWPSSGPGQRPPKAMMGDPLRKLRRTSVSELLARRCRELAETGEDYPIRERNRYHACLLADRFTRWDEAGSLSTLKALMDACRRRSLEPDQANNPSIQLFEHIAKFALVRARAGDRQALDEYAEWIPAIHPDMLGHHWNEVLEPLWTYPDHPAIAAAARAMFLDPKSAWLPLIPAEELDFRRRPYTHQIASPMACIPAYREALLAALADRTKVGIGGRPGVAGPTRRCDFVAWELSALDGSPECPPDWPEAQRDRAIAACAEYLRRYGPHLAAEYPADEPGSWRLIARLRFPILDRPATPDDVREGRAVFSAAGEGEARVVKLPSGFPVRARWVVLPALPVHEAGRPGGPGRDRLQDGWVWQAEEVFKGGRWERSYGFVGPTTIARVPASEIEFAPDLRRRLNLPSGL
ncbi:MAG: hypothetical protein FWD12_15835, partial [Alphaproteobacteria bacterium]|nr:hypothetical protein [Alphaproteobacteria bacterium]